MFYRPNSLGVEELSRNPVANALAVTFLLSTETVGRGSPYRSRKLPLVQGLLSGSTECQACTCPHRRRLQRQPFSLHQCCITCAPTTLLS